MKIQSTVELAAQIVWEYEGWGCEHVHDMHQTYKETGEKAPCTEDELHDICNSLQRRKDQGQDYEEAIKLEIEWLKEEAKV